MSDPITVTLTAARWVRIERRTGVMVLTQHDAKELRDALTELLNGSGA